MKKADKEDIYNELSVLKSSLAADKLTDDFHLPEAYFETLPQRIQEVIAGQQATKNPYPAHSWMRRHALAVAFAGIIGLAAIGFFWMKTYEEKEPLLSMDELFEMEFFSLYANLDAHYLHEMVLETNLSAEDILYSQNAQDSSEAHEEAIIDYLYNSIEHYSMDADMFIASDIQ